MPRRSAIHLGSSGGPARLAVPAVFALALALAACTPSGAGRASDTPTTPGAPAPSGSVAVGASRAPMPDATGDGATPPAATGGSTSGAPPGASPGAAPTPDGRPIAERVELSLQELPARFDSPLFATGDGTGAGRLYVVEQRGVVRVVGPDGSAASEPFVDLSDRISAGGERGLLGLAFHPRYAENGLVYVDYTDRDGNTVISELRRAPGSDTRADPGSERVLLRIDQPYPNHNGGMIAFGPDGFLYVGMGDGGAGGDPENRARDLSTLLGKILRIDVDRRDPGLGYAVPSDNPFVGRSGARAEIWASGLRNPWRFSFDQATGDLWIGDVGQGDWEEVDRLTAAGGGGRGADLGWRLMEGRACYDPPSGCEEAGLVMPLAVYGHDVGCAVTGGYVYRQAASERPGGVASALLYGTYLFSDSCSGRIWGVDAAGPGEQQPSLFLETGRPIVSFGRGDDGALYLVDIGGSVLLVVPTPR